MSAPSCGNKLSPAAPGRDICLIETIFWVQKHFGTPNGGKSNAATFACLRCPAKSPLHSLETRALRCMSSCFTQHILRRYISKSYYILAYVFRLYKVPNDAHMSFLYLTAAKDITYSSPFPTPILHHLFHLTSIPQERHAISHYCAFSLPF
jgi:hypothetical protein